MTTVKLALRQFLRNASWLLVGDTLVKAGLLLVSILVARGMGTTAMGVFTVAVGAVMIMVPLSTLGQVEVLIREIASRDAGSATSLVAAARRSQWRVLVWLLPALLMLILVVTEGELRLTLLAFLPYLPLRVETITRGAAFKGLDRMDVEVKARLAELTTVLVLIASAVVSDAPVWVTGLAFSAGGLTGLVIILIVFRHLPNTRDHRPLSRLLRMGLPFMGIAVLSQVLLRADVLIMAGLGIAQERIGHYGAATSLAWGFLALPQIAAVAIYPALSRRAAAGMPSLGPTCIAAAVGMGVGGCGIAVLLPLRGPLVALVFGAGYSTSAELLGTLLWAIPATSVAMMLGMVLAAWHAQGRALAWMLVVVAVNIALDLHWIPSAGPLGAARAAVVAHALAAIGNGLLALSARRVGG